MKDTKLLFKYDSVQGCFKYLKCKLSGLVRNITVKLELFDKVQARI